MNNSENRRGRVLQMIKDSNNPLSATAIAKTTGVSRQVIVGDVAILRAEGQPIIATARGYVITKTNEAGKYVRKIACCHTPEQTKDELNLLVGLGVYIEDVVIEHEVYGELTGSLGVETKEDVDYFIDRLEKSGARLLSELTGGIHLHTIRCRSHEHFETAITAMKEAGFLLDN